MFYIRVEAQNLLSTVLDTDKLSVTRGGSLRWREAMVGLAQRLRYCAQIDLHPVSTGASIGEFTCDIDPSDAVKRVLRYDYPELTFALSAGQSRDMCQLGTRWQQFQQLTVAPERGCAEEICDFTKIRAASASVTAQENGDSVKAIGWNVQQRHEFGRSEKQANGQKFEFQVLPRQNKPDFTPLQRFYARETGQKEIGEHDISALIFNNEFSEIATGFPFKALHNKLAVFYADGNKFSRFVVNKKDDELTSFDKAMTQMRQQLLATLLAWVVKQCDFFGPDKPIPFEVLLWGGDEYTFVLPAWLGWEFTHRFFEATKNWEFAGKPLSHAAGLVFCHHKTPIGRIRDLANELADGVKADAPMQNAFDYLVLESLDFPAQSIDDYWAARVNAAVAAARHPLRPNHAWINETPPDIANNSAVQALASLKNHQIYRLAQALAKNSMINFEDAVTRLKLSGVDDAQVNAARALFPAATASGSELDRDKWLWIHLRELGQYLCPEMDGT
jgi:hypothetical protein